VGFKLILTRIAILRGVGEIGTGAEEDTL